MVKYPNIKLSTSLGFLHINGGAVTWNSPRGGYVEPSDLLEGCQYLLNLETGVMVECDAFGVPLEAAPTPRKAPLQPHKTTKHGTPSRYWWMAVLRAIEDLGGEAHRKDILEQVAQNNRRPMLATNAKASATTALTNTSCNDLTIVSDKIYAITPQGREFLAQNLAIYLEFNK
jgi:hypothetical protein